MAVNALVRTVEGLADDHPLRSVVVGEDSADCGSCLAGLVMLAAGAIDRDADLAGDPERLHRLLTFNVCWRAGHEAVPRAVIHAAAPNVAAGQPEVCTG